MSDAELLHKLMARCVLRDERAFATLYRHTSAHLFKVARRMLRRDDLAEEVLQECFVKIWNHVDDYAVARSTPMTWMMAIVRNGAVDCLRRRRPEYGQEDFDLFLESIPDDSPAVEERLDKRQEVNLLSACLDQLTPSQRQVVTLAYWYGLSHEELSAHLGEPLGTVKSWVRRGLNRLSQCMQATGR